PLIGNQAEQVRDAVEARAALVIRGNDVPGRIIRVRGLEHDVSRPRVLKPSAPRAQVRWAQLPLAQRVIDACLEAALLLRVAYLQPELDEQNPVIDDVHLELGADLEESLVFCFRAKAH